MKYLGLLVSRQRWAAGTLVFAMLLLVGSGVSAQTSRDLWVPLVDEFTTLDRGALEQVFSEVLGSTHGTSHIVGAAGMAGVIAERGFELPSCYEGRSVCTSHVAAVARALSADRVIQASAREQGRVLHLEIFDVQLNQRSEMEIRGQDMRDTVFQAVAAVTDASAMLIVDSTPTGAALYLDDQLVGTTPYEGTLAIGAYDVRLTLDGYATLRTEFELRAGDIREETVELERLYAEIVITSTAPNAEIVVDGDVTVPAGEPFRVNPGDHELVIRAPGYNDDSRSLNLLAGETRSYRVTLAESVETLAARKYDRVRSRPFTFQLGFVGAGTRSAWNDARLRIDDERERISCPDSPGGAECGDDARVGYVGAGLDVMYDLKWLHLQLFGLSVSRINIRDNDTFSVEGQNDRMTGRAGRELHFRLPSPGIRWQVNSDWSTAFRVGPGVTFQRVEGTLIGSTDRRFRRTDWLLEMDLVARYHVTASFFAFAELDMGVALNQTDTRTRVGMTVGLGLNLPDPLGLVRPPPTRQSAPAPVTPPSNTSGTPNEL